MIDNRYKFHNIISFIVISKSFCSCWWTDVYTHCMYTHTDRNWQTHSDVTKLKILKWLIHKCLSFPNLCRSYIIMSNRRLELKALTRFVRAGKSNSRPSNYKLSAPTKGLASRLSFSMSRQASLLSDISMHCTCLGRNAGVKWNTRASHANFQILELEK